VASKRYTAVSILISIVLATALWLYVSLIRTYEGDIHVPLVVVPPAGQTILSNVPKFITVHVRTSGFNIVSMRHVNQPQACTLTVAKLRSVGAEQYVVSEAELLTELSDVIASRMLSTMPSELTFITGTPVVKKVPVMVPHSITVRSGFVLASPPTPLQSMVTIRGMASAVDGIQSWSTKKIFIEDAHESVVMEMPVIDSLASSLDVTPKSVRVKIDIQRLADQEIRDIPVTASSGMGMADVIVRPSHINITVRGGVDNIAKITRDDVTVEVDASGRTGYVVPKVSLRQNARVVAITPRMVHVVRVARR
jgi:hypothetical protein